MKIACFTQTYGTNRRSEMELLRYDLVGNAFRLKCDYIIFSFHNCPQNLIELYSKILKDLYPPDKLIILIYNNISYYCSLLRTIDFYKKQNIEYMLLIQDDQFGFNNEYNLKNLQNIDSIFKFVYSRKPYYFNMLSNHGDKNINKVETIEEIKIDDVEFYNYYTNTFNYCYSYNDGTHFINIDFLEKGLLKKCHSQDVWNLENERNGIFLNNKYHRWGMNKVMFTHLSVHGKNIMKIEERPLMIDYVFSGIKNIDKIKEDIIPLM
jgi:hypothetical protein